MQSKGKRKTFAEMTPQEYIRRIFSGVFIIYVVCMLLFFVLTGEQLRYKDSDGNTEALAATAATVELAEGAVVTQDFTTQIEIFEEISVVWGTYYRENAGTITMEFLRTDTGEVLASEQFDAAELADGGTTAICLEEPLEGLIGVPLQLRLTADSPLGQAAAPMMYQGEDATSGGLMINGEPVDGVLCMSMTGTDGIFFGAHYWAFVIGGAIVLGGILLVLWKRYQRGQTSRIIYALLAVKNYKFLIKQLVSRDFKVRYKRSVLGVFWSFLNPLLTMLVQYFVFSQLFRSDIEYYPAYLLTGIVAFNFMTEAAGLSLTSIVGNANLITKVYMPKYIYPLTRVLSSLINLVISWIPLLLVSVITGVHFHKSVLLALYFMVCLVIFTLGLSLFLSAAMVFFRDVQFLWGIFSMLWMYMTPIFYPESIIPEQFRFVLDCNPMYYFIRATRLCILDGISPQPVVYLQSIVIALITLLIGSVVFHKSQNRFVLYL